MAHLEFLTQYIVSSTALKTEMVKRLEPPSLNHGALIKKYTSIGLTIRRHKVSEGCNHLPGENGRERDDKEEGDKEEKKGTKE